MNTSKYVFVGGSVYLVESADGTESPESRAPGSILKWFLVSALVVLLTVGTHQVVGSVFESEAEATSEEAEFEHLPPAYAFGAVDFDDPFDAY